MALSPGIHRALRIAFALVIAGGVGLATHRLRRSQEQVELTRYVERELPPMIADEQAFVDGMDALLADRKLPAAEARKRLLDELTPKMVRLRHRAEAIAPTTVTVRQLAAEYLGVIDAWTEAARSALRAIDDPKLTTEASVLSVRERLADAARAAQTWREHLVATCEHHHLAPPRR